MSSQSDSERLENDSRSTSNVTNQLRRRFERQRIPNDRPSPGADNIAVNQRANNEMIIIGQFAVLIFIIFCVIIKWWYLPILPSPQGPIIEINTKRHVPRSSSSWKLVARRKAYNSSYSIKQCKWREVYPTPTSPQNTVLPGGTKDCLPEKTSHDIDATLDNLQIPSHRENYVFEISCTDSTGNSGRDSVNILVNELREPTVTVITDTLVIPASSGIAKLEASC